MSPGTVIEIGSWAAWGVLDLRLWTRYDDPAPLLDRSLTSLDEIPYLHVIYSEPVKAELDNPAAA